MVVALRETLLDDTRRDVVIADAQALIDAEVAEKGLAVKGGYAAVKKAKATIVPEALDRLLPDFFAQLQPYWDEFAGSEGRFGDFLVARGDAVADALLSVTDSRVEASSRTAIKKVYNSMRSAAKKNVIEALPRLGDLVQKHAV